MNEIAIEHWVEQAPQAQQGFRQAVHIILDGIGHSHELKAKMVMKGGLLLAIRYDSSRYTRDLDFSTQEKYIEKNAEALLQALRDGLVAAENRLSYPTLCRLQSHKVQPKGENKTHHSLALKIGFADRSNAGQMARLHAGTAASVVEIDYSFNEAVVAVEVLELEGGATIHAYSLTNVLAEKMRSLLQQPIRNRTRRQDVYDIWLLLDSAPALTADALAEIHQMLLTSCRSKGIEAEMHAMESERVVAMARNGYASLEADVEGELPSFEVAMARVIALYRSLPW